MANLYEKAKAANQRILNKGFSVPATIENNLSESQDINIFFIDVGLGIEPETGFPIVSNKMAVSFHIDDLTITHNDNFEKWKITFVNSKGETRTGAFNDPMQDRTLGMITTTLRIIE